MKQKGNEVKSGNESHLNVLSQPFLPDQHPSLSADSLSDTLSSPVSHGLSPLSPFTALWVICFLCFHYQMPNLEGWFLLLSPNLLCHYSLLSGLCDMNTAWGVRLTRGKPVKGEMRSPLCFQSLDTFAVLTHEMSVMTLSLLHYPNFLPPSFLAQSRLYFDLNYTPKMFGDCIFKGCDAIVVTKPVHTQKNRQTFNIVIWVKYC